MKSWMGCKKSKFDLLKCTNISGFESLPLMREVGGDSRSEGVKRSVTPFVPPSVSFAAKVSCRDFIRLLKEDVSLV